MIQRVQVFLSYFVSSMANYFDSSCLRPVSKENANALAVMRPTNTLGNCRTNIDSDKLFAQILMLFLWNGICNLSHYESKMLKPITGECIPPTA